MFNALAGSRGTPIPTARRGLVFFLPVLFSCKLGTVLPATCSWFDLSRRFSLRCGGTRSSHGGSSDFQETSSRSQQTPRSSNLSAVARINSARPSVNKYLAWISTTVPRARGKTMDRAIADFAGTEPLYNVLKSVPLALWNSLTTLDARAAARVTIC